MIPINYVWLALFGGLRFPNIFLKKNVIISYQTNCTPQQNISVIIVSGWLEIYHVTFDISIEITRINHTASFFRCNSLRQIRYSLHLKSKYLQEIYNLKGKELQIVVYLRELCYCIANICGLPPFAKIQYFKYVEFLKWVSTWFKLNESHSDMSLLEIMHLWMFPKLQQ